MRVCVLYDDEPYGFTPADFLKNFDWEMVLLHRPVMDRLSVLARENRFDVYFNLCDGSSDEDYPGLDVVQALEELNLPFTGADSKFYDPTREEMQAAAEAHGVGFAKGFHVTDKDELESIVKDLRFPLMVKHPKSYSSIGMTREFARGKPGSIEMRNSSGFPLNSAAPGLRSSLSAASSMFLSWIIRTI